jgi:hypothetical protein
VVINLDGCNSIILTEEEFEETSAFLFLNKIFDVLEEPSNQSATGNHDSAQRLLTFEDYSPLARFEIPQGDQTESRCLGFVGAGRQKLQGLVAVVRSIERD